MVSFINHDSRVRENSGARFRVCSQFHLDNPNSKGILKCRKQNMDMSKTLRKWEHVGNVHVLSASA
jgi:hypothetical protein